MTVIRVSSSIIFIALSFCDPALAQDNFFSGKTIRIVVGSIPGGGYDYWARLLARHMSKYIPGNPELVVQNMPGGGSLVATNYVYSVAKPDGQTVVVNNAALYFEQLLKRKEVQYDWSKFTWVGSMTPTSVLLYMWAAAPYKTIHDVRTATVPPKCGATGTGNTSYYLPKLLEEAIGPTHLWIAAYCNDVFGYMPSARVLREGGYETRGLYAGGVGVFDPGAERVVVESVRDLARKAGRPLPD